METKNSTPAFLDETIAAAREGLAIAGNSRSSSSEADLALVVRQLAEWAERQAGAGADDPHLRAHLALLEAAEALAAAAPKGRSR